MTYACTQDRFRNDVKDHRMTIVKDDGVFRSIRFARPHSGTYSFTLTTFPGHLVITGDCGAYVFARLYDMFEFFNGEVDSPEYGINPYYWAEKAEAVDRRGSLMNFSSEKFAAELKRYMNNYFEDSFDTPEEVEKQRAEAIEVLEENYWGGDVDSIDRAYQFLSDLDLKCFDGWDDLWDYDLEEYSFGYIWCCYAIHWGIRQFRLGGTPVQRQEKTDKLILAGKL